MLSSSSSSSSAAGSAVIVVLMPAGAGRRTVWVARPAGVVLTTRFVGSRGISLSVVATIPGIAAVGVGGARGTLDACRDDATHTTCARDQEWCPMPAARWRVTLTKRSGPAGVVRVTFRVGRR
jgi:hypothetical protein